MHKVFILKSQEAHYWHSCTIIEKAIEEALSGDLGFRFVEVDPYQPELLLGLLGPAQAEEKRFVYFLSDNLNFQAITQVLQEAKDLIYLIPVFGNMTYKCQRWMDLSSLLMGQKVVFLGASHRSCQQLSLLINGGSIIKCPYPVSEQHFSRSESSQDLAKIHLIYSGRLSIQKNILEILNAFLKAVELNPKLHLHIAGSFDEIGFHLHGRSIDLDAFEADFLKKIESSKEHITYHGLLGQEELSQLNARCDYVLSASTYHDEDFGISVAQSLGQGLTPLLSDWGGHPDFVVCVGGELIPLQMNLFNIPTISTTKLFKILLGLEKLTPEQRLKNREKAREYLSIKVFRENFLTILGTEVKAYQGQSALYREYAEVFFRGAPFSSKGQDKKIHYLDIYKSYLSDILPRDYFLI